MSNDFYGPFAQIVYWDNKFDDNQWWENIVLPDDHKYKWTPSEFDSDYKYRIEYEEPKENMNELLKKYHKTYMTAEVAMAYELGAMDEDGNLTGDGIDLLKEIFVRNEEMRKIFFTVIEEMSAGEKKNVRKK